MDCPGIEPGFPSVVKSTSVMKFGRVVCLLVAPFGMMCTVFVYVTFVACHNETRPEMLDENARTLCVRLVSHKRRDPRSFARGFVGKSKYADSPRYLVYISACDNTATAKT